MTLQFDFDMEDWMEFQKHFIANSKRMKRTKWMITLIPPVIMAFVFLSNLSKREGGEIAFGAMVVMMGLWIWLYPKRFDKRVLKQVRNTIESGDNSAILGSTSIQFEEEGITHKTPEVERKLKWSGIKRVGESDEYFFLYDSAVSAIVIPKKKIQVAEEELREVLKANMLV
ncbi:YcxB family protein [bacterium SCSIO 12741]|nr:YcxB family protein [bacterium SCSIO 12741]